METGFTVKIPSGMPGRYPDDRIFHKVLGKAVRKKWHTPEEKEAWYTKFSAARRRKTARLFHQQNGICVFCKEEAWLGEADRAGRSKNKMATLEHIIPQSAGGTDHMSNLVMSCHSCNNLRGPMKFNKFLKLRNNPEAWKAHARALAGRLEPRRKKRKEKRIARQIEVMWQLLFLLHYRPEWQEVFDRARAEMDRRRAHVLERRKQKQANNPAFEIAYPELVDK